MHAVGVLFEEGDFPVVVAERGDTAVIGPVDEFAAGPLGFALERGEEIVAVDVDLVGAVADFCALEELLFGVGISGGGDECG